MDQLVWIRLMAVLLICALGVAAWHWIPLAAMKPDEISASVEPYRHAWYALPMVMLAFIVLGLFPVLLLITATGIAFGPVLGPIYAMAGCLASASMGFAIGRWLGMRRVERLGGERITRVTRALNRNGTLAVFFVRKVPAPFTLVNIVIGASTVRYGDFILGTVLGMGALVSALAGFGYQLTCPRRTLSRRAQSRPRQQPSEPHPTGEDHHSPVARTHARPRGRHPTRHMTAVICARPPPCHNKAACASRPRSDFVQEQS